MSDKQIVHVIDDDRAILTSTAGFLTAKRFVVQTYTSAMDFLEEIGPHTAGCVVTDVRMPGISGIELMSKLRERGLALPIIIVTAHADILLAVEAMKRGAVDLRENRLKMAIWLGRSAKPWCIRMKKRRSIRILKKFVPGSQV